MAEAVFVGVRDGDDAVAREGVGRGESGGDFSIGVGEDGGEPERAGGEIFAQPIGGVATAADEIAFVEEAEFIGVFGEERGDRRGGARAERVRRVEERIRLGRASAHEAEDGVIDGVERDLGAGDGLFRVVGNGGGDGDGLAGFVIGGGRADGDGEA